MHKLVTTFGLILLFFSCKSVDSTSEFNNEKETVAVFPVTEFLQGQLKEIEKSPITALKETIVNDKIDSLWISRDSIRIIAAPFLTPLIDSASLSPYFDGDSFMDQTINFLTLTYNANERVPENFHLRRIDIYIQPESNIVSSIYLLKENSNEKENTKVQLTWKANESFSIRTITQMEGMEPIIKLEKVTWDFK
ncbi:MAG: hypothetical protein ABIN48_04610 [Ginsengibacter sp.]